MFGLGALSADTRTGYGKSLYFSYLNTMNAIITPVSEFVVAFGVKFSNAGGIVLDMYAFDTTGSINTTQIQVTVDATRAAVLLYRGSTLIWDSGNHFIPMNVWMFWEFKIKIHPSDGYFHMRVNNQPTADLTGINTRVTNNSLIGGIAFHGHLNNWFLLDDFRVSNAAVADPGPYPMDDFAGDMRVIALYPIGNNSVTFSPFPGGTQNWQNVDEINLDRDTTYNSSDVVGDEDTFNFEALPSSINFISSVQVVGAYRKDLSGTRTLTQQLISGSTEVAGTNYSLSNNYTYYMDEYKLDPDTGAAWTVSGVNALKAGYRITG